MNETNSAAIEQQKNSKHFLQVLNVVIFLGLCALVFLNLGKQPLRSYDEAVYAQIAKQAVQNNHYIGLEWLGNKSLQKPWLGPEGMQRSSLFLEKPPLVVWLIALAYKIFGISEFTSRIWVALFALASMAFSFYFVKKIFNSGEAAVLSLAFFGLCYQYLLYAQILQLDIPVGFFDLGAIGFFYLAGKQPKYFYGFWICLALGVMAKNIIGLIPLAVVGMYSLIIWDLRFFITKKFWLGFGLFLLLVLPWHIYVFLVYKQAFWEQYVTLSVLQRFSTTLNQNGGPWDFYLKILQNHRLLYYSSIISLSYFLFRAWQNRKSPYSLVIISVLVIFFVFSSSQSKLPPYILMLYPWLAILNGVAWAEIINKISSNRSKLQYAATVLAVVVCVIFGIKYTSYKNEATDQAAVDDKNIGLFLKNNYSDKTAYNYAQGGTNPTIIFYSNRVLYYLEKGSRLPEKKLILITPDVPEYQVPYNLIYSTPTKNLYLINGQF